MRHLTLPSLLALFAVIQPATPVAAAPLPQHEMQVAVQLGAVELGINLSSATASQVQNCLSTGSALLKATNTTTPYVQTSAFRFALLEASRRALETPQTWINPVVGLNLDPRKTKPSAIVKFITTRVPNFAPTLVESGVRSVFLGQGFPEWGFTGSTPEAVAKAQMKDATAIAASGMRAALIPYAKGTRQWAPVPKTGPAIGATYLPNFTTKPINSQPSDPTAIADVAAAVASQAINGLGTASGLYGKSPANIEQMTTSLTKAIVAFQKPALNGAKFNSKAPDSQPMRLFSGGIGGSTLGIVAQLAGSSVYDWAVSQSALDGIIRGAVKASKSPMSLIAIAYGAASGFAGTYLATTDPLSQVNETTFINTSADAIVLSILTAAKIKLTAPSAAWVADAVGDGIADAYSGAVIPGAAGIANFGYNNAVGTPVTDTVGI